MNFTYTLLPNVVPTGTSAPVGEWQYYLWDYEYVFDISDHFTEDVFAWQTHTVSHVTTGPGSDWVSVTIDGDEITVSGTPLEVHSGNHDIVITLTDSASQTGTITIPVEVKVPKPVDLAFTVNSQMAGYEFDQTIPLSSICSEPDGIHPITYSFSSEVIDGWSPTLS